MTVPVVRLALPEPPSANRWWRMWRNRMVKSGEATAYQERVRVMLADLGFLKRTAMGNIQGAVYPKPHPVSVTIVWTRSARRGDLDKRLGILLDAMQGAVYENDSQIAELHAFRDDSMIGVCDTGAVHVSVSAVAALTVTKAVA